MSALPSIDADRVPLRELVPHLRSVADDVAAAMLPGRGTEKLFDDGAPCCALGFALDRAGLRLQPRPAFGFLHCVSLAGIRVVPYLGELISGVEIANDRRTETDLVLALHRLADAIEALA